MSDKTTIRMISAYFQNAQPTRFLSGFFQTPAINFHNSQDVEIDIERSDEDVATVITDLSTGGNLNSFDGFTNKKFTPPIFDEKAALNSFDLIKRMPGDDPFKDPSFMANAIVQAFKSFRLLEGKVRRAVELMAAQVLQTGTLTLNNKLGVPSYLLNFMPKATHFPTVSTNWSAGGSTKLEDLRLLAEEIRTDGLMDPTDLIFGSLSWEQFRADPAVQAELDNRRYTTGEVRPESRGQGATYQGYIWIGDYRFNMWTYKGRYRDPVTNVSTKYLNDNKVIMLSEGSRFDLTFGAIPLIQRSGRALPGLPERMTSTANGFGLTTNSWVTEDGANLFVSAGTRPLVIPTAIDTYGCLTTQM